MQPDELESIRKLASRIGMQGEEWFSRADEIADPDMDRKARGLRVRRTGKLGRAGELTIVDRAHASLALRDDVVLVRRGRQLAHSALRIAQRLELGPRATVGKRLLDHRHGGSILRNA